MSDRSGAIRGIRGIRGTENVIHRVDGEVTDVDSNLGLLCVKHGKKDVYSWENPDWNVCQNRVEDV